MNRRQIPLFRNSSQPGKGAALAGVGNGGEGVALRSRSEGVQTVCGA